MYDIPILITVAIVYTLLVYVIQQKMTQQGEKININNTIKQKNNELKEIFKNAGGKMTDEYITKQKELLQLSSQMLKAQLGATVVILVMLIAFEYGLVPLVTSSNVVLFGWKTTNLFAFFILIFIFGIVSTVVQFLYRQTKKKALRKELLAPSRQ